MTNERCVLRFNVIILRFKVQSMVSNASSRTIYNLLEPHTAHTSDLNVEIGFDAHISNQPCTVNAFDHCSRASYLATYSSKAATTTII